MTAHRPLHRRTDFNPFCKLLLLGLVLVGCQAVRGPEPLGPTYVSPPGPIVNTPGNRPARVTPPSVALPESPQTFTPTPVPQAILQQPAPAFVPQASPVYMQLVAPNQGAAGGTVTYRIEVQNRAPSIARGVNVTCPLTPGLTYVSSNPPAMLAGQQLQWALSDLPGQGAAAVEVSFRAESIGTANFCADVHSAGSVLRACAATPISGSAVPAPPGGPNPADGVVPPPPSSASPLSVTVSGPQQARLGEEIEFRIRLVNRGSTPLSQLVMTDSFDAGLEHRTGQGPITRAPPDLEPGKSLDVVVKFRVIRAGRLCNRVEVKGQGGLTASAESCVVVAGNPALSVRMTAPDSIAAGRTGLFRVELRNTGDSELTGLVVTSRFDGPLNPKQATQFDGQQTRVSRVGEQYELSPWRFDRLEPGRSMVLEVECQGDRAAERACGRVSVAAREVASQEATACTRVVGAPPIPRGDGRGEGPRGKADSPLSVTIGSLREPARVGDEVTYVVNVTNNGRAAVTGLIARLTVSSHLSPPRAPDRNPARSSLDGRTIAFDAVGEIRPGDTLTYRIRAQALSTGAATIDVGLQADGLPAIRQQTTTTVVSQ